MKAFDSKLANLVDDLVTESREEKISKLDRKLEECLDDLEDLNNLYNKEYVTIGEFDIIRNRILDKMINITNEEKAVIERRWK